MSVGVSVRAAMAEGAMVGGAGTVAAPAVEAWMSGIGRIPGKIRHLVGIQQS